MGKRSKFDRKDKDFYETPIEAVKFVIKHLEPLEVYIDPCAGNGNIKKHIAALTGKVACIGQYDKFSSEYNNNLSYNADAVTANYDHDADFFITNPPWDRSSKNGEILHKIIDNLSSQKPTWLLFDADWMHTKQSAEYMKYCVKIVSVGRLKWFPETNQTGKDNCVWYLFDKNFTGKTEFIGR